MLETSIPQTAQRPATSNIVPRQATEDTVKTHSANTQQKLGLCTCATPCDQRYDCSKCASLARCRRRRWQITCQNCEKIQSKHRTTQHMQLHTTAGTSTHAQLTPDNCSRPPDNCSRKLVAKQAATAPAHTSSKAHYTKLVFFLHSPTCNRILHMHSNQHVPSPTQ